VRPRTPLAGVYGAAARGWRDVLGWDYPVAFGDAAEEHRRVRSDVGVFDFSFMTHLVVGGRDGLDLVQRLVTNDAGRLIRGAALYAPMCDEAGGMVDDCTVIDIHEGYLITTGLRATAGWIAQHARGLDVRLEDRSSSVAVIAVQGPRSLETLLSAGVEMTADLAYFSAAPAKAEGAEVLVARIGYTGELGYEVFAPTAVARELWATLTRDGATPCGADALDSLRIEAGYRMTQVDFDRAISPHEAGLDAFVKLDKGPFIGRDALASKTPRRRLVGLRLEDEGAVATRGARVRDAAGTVVGRVTSACASPTLGGALAFAYVSIGIEGPLRVDGVTGTAAARPLPFYDRERRRVRRPAVR
jgi:aminomethyltransferase